MGHTVASQRIVVDKIIAELGDFRKSLRSEDQPAFDRALAKVKIHIGSISYTTAYNTWALVLFSILLEQEKDLIRLEKIRHEELISDESNTDGRLQGR